METVRLLPFTNATSGRPTPSKSAMMEPTGASPAASVKLPAKLPLVRFEPLPKKVGSKNFPEYAVNPPTVTVTGANVAPAGTATVSVVALAVKTFAVTAPK